MEKKIILLLFLVIALGLNIRAQETKKDQYYCKDSIKLINIEPFKYIAYEVTGSLNQQRAAYTKLWEESTKQFLNYDRPFFAVYYNSIENTPEDSLKWEAATKLVEDEDIIEPLKKKTWAYKTVVKIDFDGPIDEELGNAYAAGYQWISKNGYKTTGPNLQRYLRNPRPNEKGVLVGKVEIWIPVMPAN